jgi:hypothetical protein
MALVSNASWERFASAEIEPLDRGQPSRLLEDRLRAALAV